MFRISKSQRVSPQLLQRITTQSMFLCPPSTQPQLTLPSPAQSGCLNATASATIPSGFRLTDHLRQALATTLQSYPQWCGRLKAIDVVDGNSVDGHEARAFPTHARPFGRLYVHFGSEDDPGVSFVEAASDTKLDELYDLFRTRQRPLWNRDDDPIHRFIPSCEVAKALEPNLLSSDGRLAPLMAVQCTVLGCGGFVLAIKTTHPMADISSLVRVVKDWGNISRASLVGDTVPILAPVFDPSQLDALAAGDINAQKPSSEILSLAKRLPMHRYDWWAQPGCPPEKFADENLPLAGMPMPWAEWDLNAPVSQYTIHLTKWQVEFLWREATQGLPKGSHPISKHDAILAHIWSCIARARKQERDEGVIHCDLVLGARSALGLDEAFLGSPIVMMNIEMRGSEVAAATTGSLLAQHIRKTVATVSCPSSLAAHLYSVAYEKSPQRIWQGFLGCRHVMVTTWAKSGIYEVDFGLGGPIRFADGVVPRLDGCIMINEAPALGSESYSSSWADRGVDLTVNIRTEDMERLLKDPLLLIPSDLVNKPTT
ncbi:transferase family protein [Cladochytrium replicatum]|nr:transferase family protein [Cladochytrium replicatum]